MSEAQEQPRDPQELAREHFAGLGASDDAARRLAVAAVASLALVRRAQEIRAQALSANVAWLHQMQALIDMSGPELLVTTWAELCRDAFGADPEEVAAALNRLHDIDAAFVGYADRLGAGAAARAVIQSYSILHS